MRTWRYVTSNSCCFCYERTEGSVYKWPQKGVALSLPISIHDQAGKCAYHFITLAIAEKLIRIDSQATEHTQVTDKEASKVFPQEAK
jgi:hypothetical protein